MVVEEHLKLLPPTPKVLLANDACTELGEALKVNVFGPLKDGGTKAQKGEVRYPGHTVNLWGMLQGTVLRGNQKNKHLTIIQVGLVQVLLLFNCHSCR